MAVVLICSNRSLDGDLKGTLLFRSDIRREQVRSITEAQTRLAKGGVALFCIHREVRGVEALINSLRKTTALKRTSIVVFSEDDFDPSEIDLLEAGANAILRLPPADDFDQRIGRLVKVPARKDVRLPVRLQVGASNEFGATVPVLAVNLSTTGILVESNHSLHMGDEVKIALRFEESGELFLATAHVTRTAGPNRYGAKFTSITKGEEALTNFLSSSAVA